MDKITVDIILLFILLLGIYWMNNNRFNIKNIIYIIVVIIIIDLRTILLNL